MIYFGNEHQDMLKHIAEETSSRMAQDADEWVEADYETVKRVERMGQSPSSFVLTGGELNSVDARRIVQKVVEAELHNWVPNASQRLIYRVSKALDVRIPTVLTSEPDCGAEPGWHALTGDFVVNLFIRRCVTCGRFFADGTPQ